MSHSSPQFSDKKDAKHGFQISIIWGTTLQYVKNETSKTLTISMLKSSYSFRALSLCKSTSMTWIKSCNSLQTLRNSSFPMVLFTFIWTIFQWFLDENPSLILLCQTLNEFNRTRISVWACFLIKNKLKKKNQPRKLADKLHFQQMPEMYLKPNMPSFEALKINTGFYSFFHFLQCLGCISTSTFRLMFIFLNKVINDLPCTI